MNQDDAEQPPQSQQQRVGDVQNQGNDNILNIVQGQNITLTQTKIIRISIDEIKTRKLNPASPYKGLKTFEPEDVNHFFGRDQFLDELSKELRQTNLLLLLGASGSGKSSVIRAGLIPRLQKRFRGRLVTLMLTPDCDPFESFYASLLSQGYKQSQVQLARVGRVDTLSRVIKNLRRPKLVFLIFIDQFEELFTISEPRKRNQFIQGLYQISREKIPGVRIVATMRSDFLNYLDPFPVNLLAKLTQKHRPLITAMHPDELRLAIEQPAAHHGVVFEAGLVEGIIKDVQGQAGYLPLLQYTLDLLWEAEVKDGGLKDRTLNISSYRRLGGVRGALQKHIDQIYQELPEVEKLATQRIFLRLVGIDGNEAAGTEWKPVRRRASRAEFQDRVEQAVLLKLIDEKLLVSDSSVQATGLQQPKTQDSIVEIAHEILLTSWTTLKAWIRENRQSIALRNRLNDDVKIWQNNEKVDSDLWSGAKLTQVIELCKDSTFREVLGGFSDVANQFIDASVEMRDRIQRQKEDHRQRELKRARKVAILASVAAIAITAISFLALFQWQEAQKLSVLAFAESARANLLANRSMEGTIDAVKAVKLLRNPLILDRKTLYTEVSDALIWANSENKERLRLQEVQKIEFSPNSQFIVSYERDTDMTATLRSITGEKIASLGLGGGATEFSPDSKFFINDHNKGVLQLWSTSGQLIRELSEVAEPEAFGFSPNSELIAISDAKTTKLWNTSGELITERPGRFTKFAEYAVGSEERKFFLTTWSENDSTSKTWTVDGSIISKIPVEVPSGVQIPASVPGRFVDFAGTSYVTFDSKFNGKFDVLYYYIWNTQEKSLQSISYTNKYSLGVVGPNASSQGELSLDGQFLLTAGSERDAAIWSVKLWAISKNRITSQVKIDRPLEVSGDRFGAIPYILPNRELIAFRPLYTDTNFPALVSFSGQEIITAQHQLVAGSSKYVLTTGGNSSARLWDLSGNSIAQFDVALDASLPRVQFSPNEQFFATITSGGTMQLWNLSNSWTTLIPKAGLESESTRRVEFSPNGQLLAEYTNAPASVSLWDMSGKPVAQLPFKPEERIQTIKFSPDTQVLAIVSEGYLRIWDVSSRSFTAFQVPLKGAFEFSLDGQQIIIGDEGIIKIWDIASGHLVKEFQASSEEVEFIGLNRNGEIVLVDDSNEDNPSIQRWSTLGKQIQSFNVGQKLGDTFLNPRKDLIADGLSNEPGEPFTRLLDGSGTVIAEKLPGYFDEFSPRGESLATVDREAGIVYLWKVDGTLLKELPGYQRIESVRFSADGQLVIVRHGDGVRSVLDISGRLLMDLPDMQGGIKSARFSPVDSKLLTTVGNDGTIKLLRLDNRQTLLQTACNQISAYLQSEASDLSDSDRRLCDGITSP